MELARRNPLLDAEPARLPVGGVTGLEPDEELPGALRSQVRALGAAADARLVLIPLELGWEAPGDAANRDGRAVLRLALLDVRSGRLLWRGSVYGEPAAVDEPAALATLAQKLTRSLTP